MKLTLIRKYPKPKYTIGKLYINGEYFCDTIEDTDRGLTQTMPKEEILAKKIKTQTAIPRGTYQVYMKMQSPKFATTPAYAFCKGYLPRLLKVPGYEGILIHIGNKATQTAGCILVGKNKAVGKVLESTETFRSLYSILKEADQKGEKIYIEIKI
jgi:hypothetical protein